jgi:hypothetical protein
MIAFAETRFAAAALVGASLLVGCGSAPREDTKSDSNELGFGQINLPEDCAPVDWTGDDFETQAVALGCGGKVYMNASSPQQPGWNTAQCPNTPDVLALAARYAQVAPYYSYTSASNHCSPPSPFGIYLTWDPTCGGGCM